VSVGFVTICQQAAGCFYFWLSYGLNLFKRLVFVVVGFLVFFFFFLKARESSHWREGMSIYLIKQLLPESLCL
jgi:hypothetical protein